MKAEEWKAHLRELGLARKRRTRGSASDAPATDASGVAARAPHIETGRDGEVLAAKHLEALGASILARNVRYSDGELDLVVEVERVLAFVEVKRRRTDSRGTAAESVTPLKRARMVRAARRWLGENPSRVSREVRFDVVAIQDEPGRIDWIRGAFDAS